MHFEFTLDNFPDWVLPYVNVIPIFYSEDGVPFPEDIDIEFSHWFKKTNNGYILYVYLRGAIDEDDSGTNFPLYCDLNMHIINPRNYSTIEK